MAIVIGKGDDTVRIHVKGASEVILARCSQKLAANGEIESLDQDEKDSITDKVITSFAE